MSNLHFWLYTVTMLVGGFALGLAASNLDENVTVVAKVHTERFVNDAKTACPLSADINCRAIQTGVCD